MVASVVTTVIAAMVILCAAYSTGSNAEENRTAEAAAATQGRIFDTHDTESYPAIIITPDSMDDELKMKVGHRHFSFPYEPRPLTSAYQNRGQLTNKTKVRNATLSQRIPFKPVVLTVQRPCNDFLRSLPVPNSNPIFLPPTFVAKTLVPCLKEYLAANQNKRNHEEILASIRQQGVDLRDTNRQQGADLRDIRQQEVDLRDTIHQHGVDLRDTILQQGVDLRDTILQQGVDLRDTILQQGVDLRDTILQQGVDPTVAISKIENKLDNSQKSENTKPEEPEPEPETDNGDNRKNDMANPALECSFSTTYTKFKSYCLTDNEPPRCSSDCEAVEYFQDKNCVKCKCEYTFVTQNGKVTKIGSNNACVESSRK